MFTVVRTEERCWLTDKICHVTWTRGKQIIVSVLYIYYPRKIYNTEYKNRGDNLRRRSVFAHQYDRIVIAKLLLVFFPALAHFRLEAHSTADALGHQLMRPRMTTISCSVK